MLNKPKFRYKDVIRNVLTYGGAAISFAVLMMIVVNVFIQGIPLLNMDLIVNNYESVTYVTELKEGYNLGNHTIDFEVEEDVYYSTKWGIALRDDTDLLGKNIIYIDYIHKDSPLLIMHNKGVGQNEIKLKSIYAVVRLAFTNQPSALSIQGAENMIHMLDMVEGI